jgi:hypothetical protein
LIKEGQSGDYSLADKGKKHFQKKQGLLPSELRAVNLIIIRITVLQNIDQ